MSPTSVNRVRRRRRARDPCRCPLCPQLPARVAEARNPSSVPARPTRLQLNILGAVLFLRVGFAVGMMGWPAALAIFCFSELIAYLTITSFSALVTNGRMRGGGAYYMISRSLGPAFGGSSGLLFWITYCLNVTFNTVAFTETFVKTFFEDWNTPGHQIIISTITLFILFLVAFKGAGAFARVNLFIFVGLIIALVCGIGGLYFNGKV